MLIVTSSEFSMKASPTKTNYGLKKDDKRPRHFLTRTFGVLPWSRGSTKTANCQSLMYGDLAELPTKQSKRSNSRASSSVLGNETIAKRSDVKLSSRILHRRVPSKTSAMKPTKLERPHGPDEVSREQLEFMWDQYQQLSRMIQEALRERTAELAYSCCCP